MSEQIKTFAGPPGHLFFHNPETDPARRDLATFIIERGYHGVAVFGSDAAAETVHKSLQSAIKNKAEPYSININIILVTNADDLRVPGIDLLVFASMYGWDDLKVFRYIAHTCMFGGDVVIPESGDAPHPPEPDMNTLPDTPEDRIEHMKEQLRKTRVHPAPRRLTGPEMEFVSQRREIIRDMEPLPPCMYQWPLHPFETARPVATYWFPCAGTNRINPPFCHLMTRWGWDIRSCDLLMRNAFYINNMKTEDGFHPPPAEDYDNSVLWLVKTCDYFHAAVNHTPISLRILEKCDITLLVLLRDPRDIINSIYHRTMAFGQNNGASREDWILNILNGFTRFTFIDANSIMRWPNVKSIVDDYLFAAALPNAHIIRFEDLHASDALAMRDMMTRAGLHPHPLMHIPASHFEAAAYMGGFEYQTGGRFRRGQDSSYNPEEERRGVSCRKGVVGDWRGSFTPAAVSLFKKMTGDGLVRLGYEKDNSWEL